MSVMKVWTKRLLPTVMVAWITGCTPTEVKVHDGLFDTWVEQHRGLELEIREDGTARVFGYETTWRAPDEVPTLAQGRSATYDPEKIIVALPGGELTLTYDKTYSFAQPEGLWRANVSHSAAIPQFEMVGEVNRFSLTRKAYFNEPFQPADFAMALDGLPVYGMEPALLQPGWLLQPVDGELLLYHSSRDAYYTIDSETGVETGAALSAKVTDIADGIYMNAIDSEYSTDEGQSWVPYPTPPYAQGYTRTGSEVLVGTKLYQVLDKSSDTDEQVLSPWRADLSVSEPAWQKLSDIPYSTEFLTNDFYVSPAGSVMIRRADTYHFSVNGYSWYQDTKTTGYYPVGTFSDGFILVSEYNVQFHRPATAQWMEYGLNGLTDNVSVRRVESDLFVASQGDALVGMRPDGTIITLIEKLVETDSTRLIALYGDKIAIQADTVFVKDWQ